MVRNNMSDFSKTYTRSKKKKRVDEPEGVSDLIEVSGASSGPILRFWTSKASQPAVDEIVEEEKKRGMKLLVMIMRVKRITECSSGTGKDQQMMMTTMMMKRKIMVEGKEVLKKKRRRWCLRSVG
jgi:hypothetical protein